MSIADILERAADLIEPEGAWCQRAFQSGEAHCMVGALVEAAIETGAEDVMPALNAAGFERAAEAFLFNDAPGRAHAEVVSKLREAAAKARGNQP